jgi:hypothetical protein
LTADDRDALRYTNWLRRASAPGLVSAGVDVKTAQSVLGHTDAISLDEPTGPDREERACDQGPLSPVRRS